MLLATAAALAIAAGLTIALAHGGRSSASGSPVTRPVGPAPASARIGFALVLRLPGGARLRAALAAIENPRSPRFRHFIGPSAFGRKFGISSEALIALVSKARAAGLTVTATYPQRTELDVSATIGTIERLFSVRLLRYTDRAGHSYYAPSSEPKVPPVFKPQVDGVVGLDTRPRLIAHDVPTGGLTPSLAASGYDIAALHAAGASGQGQRIAVISFSAFNPSDPPAYAQQYGISGPEPQVIPVDGGTTDTAGQAEANLDIDVIRAIAPAAQILFYESPNNGAEYSRMINQIVRSGNVQIISSSWGQCELGLDPQERAADSAALSSAIAAGVTMFVATGDAGAYDCQGQDPTDHRLSVDWPASSADAVAVGGTRLYLGPNDTYQKETAWEDQLSDGGGGGGFSSGDARPSWQSGPGVLDSFSNGHRQLPDVAADADPATGWSIYVGGSLGQAGGTSAAAPFWASSMLLVEQYAASAGVRRLGFVDPLLYALAASRQPFAPFHPVSGGGNRFYQASAGWNPATGLGSPDVFNLARDVVAYLRSHGR
jgi:kumamolisin